MGLTHYYRSHLLPQKKFSQVGLECKRICERAQLEGGFELVYALSTKNEPYWGYHGIVQFNAAEEGCEDFYVRQYESGNGFCKTNGKPYDLAVRCCLIVFKHFFQKKFLVSSDDEDDDPQWVRARQLCQEVLGYGWDFRLDQRKYHWRFVKAGMPAGPFKMTTNQFPRNLRVQQAVLPNGWTIRKHGTNTVCSVWDSSGERLTFRNFDKAGAQLYAARLFLLGNDFNGAPGLEEYVTQFYENGDWTVLAVWADYLAEHGEVKKERLLRELLPRFVPGAI